VHPLPQRLSSASSCNAVFDSGKFSGILDPSTNAQYSSLAWATFMLIVLTMTYYVFAFILDAVSVLQPGVIHELLNFTDRCSSKAARAVRAQMLKRGYAGIAGGLQNRAGAKRIAGALSTAETSVGNSSGGGDGGGTLAEMTNNPFMIARAGGGEGGGVSRGPAGGLAGLDIAASRSAVLSLPAQPDSSQWEAVRAGYAAALGALESLQAELREAKVRAAPPFCFVFSLHFSLCVRLTSALLWSLLWCSRSALRPQTARSPRIAPPCPHCGCRPRGESSRR
jgi:hypothetical protein